MEETTNTNYIKHIQLGSDKVYQIRDLDAPHDVIPDSVLVQLFKSTEATEVE